MIRLDITWTEPSDVTDTKGGAWGQACLYVNDEPIWGAPLDRPESTKLEWRWADLLEHLAWYWPWLIWEQGSPLDVPPTDPLNLRRVVETRWESMTSELVEDEGDLLSSWEQCHWLNHGLGALYVDGLCILREGQQMLVCTEHEVYRAPLTEVIKQLEQIGDTLARQVARSTSATAQALVKQWSDRQQVSPQQRATIESALPPEQALQLVSCLKDLTPFEESPLLAAARMTRHTLTQDERALVIDALKTLQPTPINDRLKSLTTSAQTYHHEHLEHEPWFIQGYELAKWLRQKLGKSGRIDPRAILNDWGVIIEPATLSPELEALAVWTSDTAGVLLNEHGHASKSKRGRRATLAHEICHLLLDRNGALPVSEVLGGAAPEHVEKRARAFAAELLVPRDELTAEVQKSPADAEKLLRRLTDRYQASKQLVAWQLKNSGALANWPEAQRAFVERAARH